MATAAQRAHLQAIWRTLLVEYEPQIHYRQHRPMLSTVYYTPGGEQKLADHLKAGHPLSLDCSETVTLVCALAGLGDPNGSRFNGWGNTQEMLDHLPHYSNPAAADVGALIVYGRPGHLAEQHVVQVVGKGKDPLCGSHGQEKGPLLVRHSVEVAAHGGHATFLSVSGL